MVRPAKENVIMRKERRKYTWTADCHIKTETKGYFYHLGAVETNREQNTDIIFYTDMA